MKLIKQDHIRIDWLNQWLPITLIMLLATGLYLHELGTESMWIDELFSIDDAKGNISLFGIRPIYYILLKFWMLFGTSDSWLRSLSVVFGLCSVFLIYQLGRHVAGEATGLIAALLLALSPLFINYTQMVRMYSLGTCLAIGGSLALVYALENPTNSSMAWWAGTRLLMNMTAPLNASLLLPDVIIFCLKFRKQRDVLLAFGKWLLLLIILWLPSLWSLLSAKISVNFLQSAINVDAKLEASSATHGFPNLVEVIRKLKHFTAFPYPSPSKAISLFFRAYTIILVFLFSFALIQKHRSGKLLWIAAWAVIPGIMIFLVSQKLWTADRYILFLSPYVLILLAAGFMKLWSWQRQVAIVVATIYLFAVSNGLVHYYTVQERQDWRGIAEVINTQEKPGDQIVISIFTQSNQKITTSLAHYYHGTAPIYSHREICWSSDIKTTNFEAKIGNVLPIERLWFICGNSFDEIEFQNTFGSRFKLENYWSFTNNKYFRNPNDIMHLFLATPNSNLEQKHQ